MKIPSVIQDGKLIIRGTTEWDDREYARYMSGCYCICLGSIGTLRFDQREQLHRMKKYYEFTD